MMIGGLLLSCEKTAERDGRNYNVCREMRRY